MPATVTLSPAAARAWPLWGGTAFIAVADTAALDEATLLAHEFLSDVTRACSRFTDSDLTRVNAAAGRWVPVGALLRDALRTAVDVAAATDGLVDPCVGRTMSWWGYDRDLTEVHLSESQTASRGSGEATWPGPPPEPTTGRWREIEVEEHRVRVPADVALDLGATAKAWAADLLAESIADRFEVPCVVSLSGDVRVVGGSWPVTVAEHPDQLQPDGPPQLAGVRWTPVETVEVSGGLATSTTLARRWAGGRRHHLLDPRTGRQAVEVFRTVSAAGRTCVAANAASTAAVVLGDQAPAWLKDRDVAARLVAADGSVVRLRWPAVTEGREEPRP